MNLDSGRRSVSPASSGRSSPVPRASRRAVEDGLFKADRGVRKYATVIERALHSWEVSPQEWADYIAFLGRLLKAIQSHPKDAPFVPHSSVVASKLAQCLNPALPSGVHQKALEVYAYIFATFGVEHTSAHLYEYLPGLSPVLSFASLSVRPALYSIFEEHITKLPNDSLRPALKSLILSLLPAVEEETAEDFERAFQILLSLQKSFSRSERSGYFWQCLFLCVITNPTRRQGALNFLTRELPTFDTPVCREQDVGGDIDHPGSLSSEAELAISLEPGLVIRSFVAGLCDQQVLVQRGFLDLLVTHLPLHSPVLQTRIEAEDLDRLMSATLQVLLRREMSLNRRLWAWFLGPNPNDVNGGSQPSSPVTERKPELVTNQLHGTQYFEAFGESTLVRCVLNMFNAEAASAAQKARPFRICLSLMDRSEIAAPLIPAVFLPALTTAHTYSLAASTDSASELLRSVSLFFDGVEASLIWSILNDLLEHAMGNEMTDTDRLHLFSWIISNFNIRDEEMLTIHIPLTALHLLSLLDTRSAPPLGTNVPTSAVDILAQLIDATPSSAFEHSRGPVRKQGSSVPETRPERRDDVVPLVSRFYENALQASTRPTMPLSDVTLVSMLQDTICRIIARTLNEQSFGMFCQVVPLMVNFLPKVSGVHHWDLEPLQRAVMTTLSAAEKGSTLLPFPALASIVTLLSMLQSVREITIVELLAFEAPLVGSLWRALSTESPKYHVEAVRLFWQIEDIIASDDGIKASLLDLIRSSHTAAGTQCSETEESLRRFMVLWSHTIPGSSSTNKTGAFGLVRRGSTMPTVADMAQAARRQETLQKPLFLVLDRLHDPGNPGFEVVHSWLSSLPSLESVLTVILEGLVTYASTENEDKSDQRSAERQSHERARSLEYYFDHLRNILRYANEWIWQCLRTSVITTTSTGDTVSGLAYLAEISMSILRSPISDQISLHRSAIAVLDALCVGPDASELAPLDLDVVLIDRLMVNLKDEDGALQGLLLRLVVKAISLRLRPAMPAQTRVTQSRGSINIRRPSGFDENPEASNTTLPVTIVPPPQLVPCICQGFASPSARFHMDHWLAFLANVLPTFSDAIFSNLLPLVECFCRELNKTFGDLMALSQVDPNPSITASDGVILSLLEGLEMILARGHECLVADSVVDPAPKQATQVNSFLGNVASGVFRAEGPPSKTAQANSRLTVVLAFQDAIKVSLSMWIWSTHYTESPSFDKTSSATTAHSSLRLRNKTRHLLEQMFAVEPLESLEVIISRWQGASLENEAAAAISLFQVMQGTRPKNIVPAILDALCSRANPSALSASRLSTQTTDLTALGVTLFLAAYIRSTEDDAMDEVWGDCIAFLRDVLANPLPYRHILPALLSIILLLAEKLGHTNFGEQRKMRRELGDIFMRTLTATFTTMPSGSAHDSLSSYQLSNDERSSRSPPNLLVVLKEVIANSDVVLETTERSSAAVNSITSSVVSGLVHAKSFPRSIDSHALEMLLECAKKAPSSKMWKKEVADAFSDPRLLLTRATLMQDGWFPVMHQWCLRDKERMPDQLSRLAPPSSAGIMFGVGASAARLEADRKTQLTIRRICLLLLASPEDAFVQHLKEFEEKLVELFEATQSSSPSSVVRAELFLLCRTLVLSLSPMRLSPLWPVINDNLQSAFTSLFPNSTNSKSFTNLGLLQACKLLDQLVALSPDEFQLHEWLYITDTIDAVYQQSDSSTHALAEQVAEVLGTDAIEDGQSLLSIPSAVTGSQGRKRQLLGSDLSIDTEDLKAMPRDDFARTMVQPFLSQLSMHAYEGVYSMDSPDLATCRRNVLDDILDLSTIVE